MSANLTAEMAQAQIDDRLAQADRFRRTHGVRPESLHEEAYDSVTVRRSFPADDGVLQALAARDGRRVPPGPLLVAEVSGRVLAARSLENGSAISDPFNPTGQLVELLALRSAHLRGPFVEHRRSRFGRLRRFMRVAAQ
jgi:hypothetical protein